MAHPEKENHVARLALDLVPDQEVVATLYLTKSWFVASSCACGASPLMAGRGRGTGRGPVDERAG